MSLALYLGLSAQTYNALPDNPDPNKCYVRCITPDVYETQTVEVVVRPAYKKLTPVPAKKETITEEVLVKEATVQYVIDPPEWETVFIDYESEEACESVEVIPASFTDSEERIEIMPAVARWEYQPYAGCQSDDPLDCQVLCWREYPAQDEAVPTKTLAKDATYRAVPGAATKAQYAREVIKTPPRVREIEVPAVYEEITRVVKVADATVEEELVPAEVTNIEKEVLVEKGGLTVWEEIECELLDFNVLPINYEFGSARLTAEARRIIDDRLLTLMQEKPNIRIEINSHTDSRGSDAANQSLSERRAQSVVDYLISRDISAGRLVAQGYGESRLKNRCADGVECSEAEHAVNRRTEFRVLNN